MAERNERKQREKRQEGDEEKVGETRKKGYKSTIFSFLHVGNVQNLFLKLFL